ncbi:hypothetical protein Tco_0907223 [Tanacetum coccineum]|uniref:MAK10-like protein n=1 Tax=Tanacetum coccineum TaxID=301880 RepID=A0ABQ5CJK5_9ASTR
MSYEDIRPIFERVWDQNNAFVYKDSKIEKEVMKRPGFNFQQKSSKKRSREDSDEDNAKKHKLEDDAEKKELSDSMDVVLRDDIAIDVESLATKYPIEDMKIIFEPNEEDEIWKNQQDYNLISWRLGLQDLVGINRDYSRPSREGYRNTIEIPDGNNVVPLRSDTFRLVQNGCSSYGLRSEDPNQHLKDFLNLVDSLDFNVANKEMTRLIDSLLGLTPKVPHHGIDLWLQLQIFYDHVNLATRRTINQAAGGKLRDKNAEESWALIEDLALYDNESWNEPRDFTSTSDYCLIKIENQVQRLMEAHLVPKPPV